MRRRRSLTDGGCDFPADPDRRADEAPQFWSLTLLPDAFELRRAVSSPDDPAALPICLSALPGLDTRISADGTWHGVWRTIGADHRFQLAIPPPGEAATGIATAASIPPAGAQTPRPVRATLVDPYAEHIAEASRRFGIPAAWIRAVMRAESAGDPRAVSNAGAIGLMQVMPTTWADLRVRHRLGIDPYDSRDNILAGTAYLRELHDRYGSVSAMLAAYNAGPARYEASLSGRPLPAETRAYVAAILLRIDGGNAAGPIMIAAADPFAWTRAPLFAAPSWRTSDADPATGGSDDAASAASQNRSLFVASVAREPKP